MCEDLIVLDQGQVIAHGPKQEIFGHPPNRTTAQLTGCKNFSGARAVDAHTVEAIDWHCTLRLSGEVSPTSTQIGIRAHHIRVEPSAAPVIPTQNTFSCWLASASEAPFRVTLYLHLHAPPLNSSDYHLQVEVGQDDWAKLRAHSMPWCVKLDSDRLFALLS